MSSVEAPPSAPLLREETVIQIPLTELHPFPNHPFKVRDDESMRGMLESVREYGVLTPAIVRPREEGGYEIVAGHRRKHASEMTELIDCMPSLGMLTINALAAADSVLIPCQANYLSTKGLKLLMGSVAKVRRQINPALKIDGILLSMTVSTAHLRRSPCPGGFNPVIQYQIPLQSVRLAREFDMVDLAGFD